MDKSSKTVEEEVETSFLEGMDDKLIDVEVDKGEELFAIVVDLLLKTDIFKEIPVVKTIIALLKEGKAISNYFLAKKLFLFIYELDKTSQKDRDEFIKEMESKKRKRIIEDLMLVLEKHDNYKKSLIQGKLFKALLEKKLTQEEYFKLTYATSMIDIESIKYLFHFYDHGILSEYRPYFVNQTRKYYLIFLQLIDIDASKAGHIDMITNKQEEIKYDQNELGRKYIEIIRE